MNEYSRYTMPPPNGSDDTAAFVAAFGATAVGSEIRLEPGTYHIQPDHPTLVFWGRKWLGSYLYPNPQDGQGTIIKPTGPGFALARMAGMGEVRNIQFDADNKCEYALWYGGHTGLVKGCHALNASAAAIFLDGATSKLEDCRASHSGVGILARGANAGMIFNCSADFNTREGLLVEGAWSGNTTLGGSVRVIGGSYAQNGTDLAGNHPQVTIDGAQSAELASAYVEGLPGNNGPAIRLQNTCNACTVHDNLLSVGGVSLEVVGKNCINNVFARNRGNNGKMEVAMPADAWAHANVYRDNVMSSGGSGGAWSWNIGGYVVTLWPWGPTAATAPTQGGWPKGFRLYDENPSPGEPIGWVCTATGFPGTWEIFGAVG